MPKSKYKPFKPRPYVESRPTSNGEGVWSDTSDITPFDHSREVLLQAMFDELHRVAPESGRQLVSQLPPEFFGNDFTLWLSAQNARESDTPSRLMTSWEWVRRTGAELRRKLLPDRIESAANRVTASRGITGAATLHIEPYRSWRFDPGFQSQADVRDTILYDIPSHLDITSHLDRELDTIYGHVARHTSRPSSRRKLRRDALRYVLREFLRLTDAHIWDCERLGDWILDDGRTVECPYQKPDDAEAPEADREKRKRQRETALDGIDHSIRHFAKDAGLSLSPQRRGRPPELEQDRKLKQERKLRNRRS